MKGKKPTTLAMVAAQLRLDPKAVRAKFRRHPKERPFNHTKVQELSTAQVVAAKKFLTHDYRAN